MPHQLTIPAMLDPHVHLRGLAWSHKATFASETAAALAGGYWAVLDMPNTPPSTISPDALAAKLAAIGAEAVSDWGVYYGASQSDNTATFAALRGAPAGPGAPVCGLKIYNNATTGDLLIDDQRLRDRVYAAWAAAFPQAAGPRRVIAVHAEGPTVADILALVRRYRQPTHFCHISTAEEIALLRTAKAEGLPVSVGVTPHHLWLAQDDLPRLGGFGRMKPELKTPADRDALWAAVGDGTVDVVESDHAPHTLAEKQADPPAFGVPGLETTLPLLLTAAHEGRLTHERVIELVAEAPRRIFGLSAPPHTYTTVDLDAAAVITRDAVFAPLHTRCGWTPFEGLRVRGRVSGVWVRGRQVFDGEQVLAAPGSGRNLFSAT